MRLFAEGYRRLSRKKGVVVLQQYVPAQPAQPSTLRTDTLWYSVGSITGSASIYVPVQLNPPDTAITWMRIENPVVGAVGEGYVFVNGYKVILTKVNEGSIDEYWGTRSTLPPATRRYPRNLQYLRLLSPRVWLMGCFSDT